MTLQQPSVWRPALGGLLQRWRAKWGGAAMAALLCGGFPVRAPSGHCFHHISGLSLQASSKALAASLNLSCPSRNAPAASRSWYLVSSE